MARFENEDDDEDEKEAPGEVVHPPATMEFLLLSGWRRQRSLTNQLNLPRIQVVNAADHAQFLLINCCA